MKKLITLALLSLTLLGNRANAAEAIVFGIDPWAAPEVLYEYHKPILQALEAKLKRKVRFFVSKDYADLIVQAKSGKLDIISFSTNNYVKATTEIPNLTYLVTLQKQNKEGELKDHYTSVIVGSRAQGIESLQDLKGKNFAFADRLSTSGYVYPNMMLRENNIDPATYFRQIFTLKKVQILEALKRGSVAGGATSLQRAEEFNADNSGALNIILKSEPIPYDAYVTAPHVESRLSNRIRDVLLNMEFDTKQLSWLAPAGFVKRSDAYYDVVRRANQAMLENR